jgi:hypothetical protein
VTIAITIEKLDPDFNRNAFRAHLKENPFVYGSGINILEAVGDLVYHNKDRFNIEVEVNHV